MGPDTCRQLVEAALEGEGRLEVWRCGQNDIQIVHDICPIDNVPLEKSVQGNHRLLPILPIIMDIEVTQAWQQPLSIAPYVSKRGDGGGDDTGCVIAEGIHQRPFHVLIPCNPLLPQHDGCSTPNLEIGVRLEGLEQCLTKRLSPLCKADSRQCIFNSVSSKDSRMYEVPTDPSLHNTSRSTVSENLKNQIEAICVAQPTDQFHTHISAPEGNLIPRARRQMPIGLISQVGQIVIGQGLDPMVDLVEAIAYVA